MSISGCVADFPGHALSNQSKLSWLVDWSKLFRTHQPALHGLVLRGCMQGAATAVGPDDDEDWNDQSRGRRPGWLSDLFDFD
jgi:hypothetical protein